MSSRGEALLTIRYQWTVENGALPVPSMLGQAVRPNLPFLAYPPEILRERLYKDQHEAFAFCVVFQRDEGGMNRMMPWGWTNLSCICPVLILLTYTSRSCCCGVGFLLGGLVFLAGRLGVRYHWGCLFLVLDFGRMAGLVYILSSGMFKCTFN